MSLSIVIPVLDEAQGLADFLMRLQGLRQQGVEIIVVDGESQDNSAAIARQWGAQVLRCPAGRSRQMNAGANQANGDILLFLHADSQLPDDAIVLSLPERLQARGLQWGFFAVRIHGRSRLLPVVATLISWRSRLSHVATGDQAIFIQQALFAQLGGFPALPLMEDVALCKQLRHHSPPLALRQKVTTSGRRWEKHGIWQTIFLMWRLRWAFWRGTPATELAKRYHY